MKKTLLLSVAASAMIFAGGDIAPVEPAVDAPAASDWDFSGQTVLYYQTRDVQGNGDLFEQESSVAAAGIQLGAVNKDVMGGIGAGFELSGISTLDLEQDVVSGMPQGAGGLHDAEITQAYLTYGLGNTSLKVGRQTLPKSLSPFAYSEGWNVFKNTFEAALLVNSDLPDTTLVLANVRRANSVINLASWARLNGATDGVNMLTVQNKSVEGLTLTGTYYMAQDAIGGNEDLTIAWGDAQFAVAGVNVGLQGGQVASTGDETETNAFGAKVGGSVAGVKLGLAYSSVDDGAFVINNVGTGIKTPLYTQAILNQNTIKADSKTVKVSASTGVLGGTLGAYYINSDLGDGAIGSTFGTGDAGAGTYTEAALTYKAAVAANTKVFAAFVNQNDDRQADDSQNFVRVWARYNF
jgi:hypothetical protein